MKYKILGLLLFQSFALTGLEKDTEPILGHIKVVQELKQKQKQEEPKKLPDLPGESPTLVHLKTWQDSSKNIKPVSDPFSLDQRIEEILRAYYVKGSDPKLREEMRWDPDTETDVPFLAEESDDKGMKENEIPHYVSLVKKIIQDEQACSFCYCFYHGYSPEFTMLFDVQREIQNWFNLHIKERIEFRLIPLSGKYQNLSDFIDKTENYFKSNPDKQYQGETYWALIKKEVLPNVIYWDQYADRINDFLISTNISLFGNTLDLGTNSFIFLLGRYVEKLFETGLPYEVLKELFKKYGFNMKYLTKIEDEAYGEMFPMREDEDEQKRERAKKWPFGQGGILSQICIPRDLVDEIVYLSHPYGTPYRIKITDSFSSQLQRHTDISSVLNKYRTGDISAFQHLPTLGDRRPFNWLEARIVLVPQFFENLDRITMRTYSMDPKKNFEKFQSELKKIINEMMTEWIVSGEYKRAAIEGKSSRLAKLITQIERSHIRQKLEKELSEIQIKRKMKERKSEETESMVFNQLYNGIQAIVDWVKSIGSYLFVS